MNRLAIELSSWILADGNYEYVSFEVGKTAKFAVEFLCQSYTISSDPLSVTSCVGRPSFYNATAKVIYRSESARVLNLGIISAFRAGANDLTVGQRVRGEVSLHVDPFVYYEQLFKLPGMPPLIYEWNIERIEMDVSPFIAVVTANGQRVLTRDDTKISYLPISRIHLPNDKAA